jgi:hypothetical protein
MNDSPNNPTNRPILVRLGLWGLKTRQSAMVFMWLCIVGAIVSVVLQFWIGSLLLLAALWYWYAVAWVDKHGGWK